MEKAKEKLLQDLLIDPGNREDLNNILDSVSAKVDVMEKRNNMLVQLLKKVQKLMDSSDYSDDFDSLYDEINLALNEVRLK